MALTKQVNTFSQENIAYWTRRAPSYSQVNQEELGSEQHARWGGVLEECICAQFSRQSREEIEVLDVGTGPGFFAILLVEMGFQVTAVDYTAAMLEQAKKNAGRLADRITFQQMDAEHLNFPSESFHVLVSRNVTWNLPHPQEAYAQWVRVLKPGGLLLNFDANWYRYLWDPQAREKHLADREQVRTQGAKDDTAGTDVQAMERIARKAPLSARLRPDWDLSELGALGMEASADPMIWKRLWTRDEWVNNASTPMFLIHARKRQGKKEDMPWENMR